MTQTILLLPIDEGGSPMDAPTWLIPLLSVYGAVVSTGALTWGVASWVLSGSRVVVEISPGAANFTGQYAQFKAERRADPDQHLGSVSETAGMTRPLALVAVRNRGRLQATVQGAGLSNKTGQSYGTFGGPEIGPRFPITLDPGQSTVLGYLRDGIDAFVAAAHRMYGRDVIIRAVIDLGSGKRVRSRSSLLFRQPAARS